MKPLLLKMTAFGPYAKETSIDFEKLNEGIYLITGDTGAGKTTIFDAIVFALYGEGSGSGRSSEMFHSDYVDKFTDTSVELTFLCRNKRYRIERTIHYKKKRGGGVGGMMKNAVFYEEGALPLEKETSVNAKVTELLGLDEKQFRQIVMLAQGEFGKFLEAKSDVREQILGRLFDNRLYMDFQNRIRTAAEELRAERADKEREISFYLTGGQTKESLREELASELENKAALEKKLAEEKKISDGFRERYDILRSYVQKKGELCLTEKQSAELLLMLTERTADCARLEAEYKEKEALLPQNEERKRKLQLAARRYKGCKKLAERMEAYGRNETALAGKQQKWQAQQADYEAAVTIYSAMHRRFLAGQAGILSQELSRTVEEKGHAFCPVCGQEVSAWNIFPDLSGGEAVPSQADVENAGKRMERERENAVKYAEDCRVLKNTLEISKKDILDEAQELFGESVQWQSMISPGEMSVRREEQRTEMERLEKQIQTSEGQFADVRQRLGKCREKIENLRGQQKSIEARKDKLTAELAETERTEEWILKENDAEAYMEKISVRIKEREQVQKALAGEREALLVSSESKKKALRRVEALMRSLAKTETAYRNLTELSLIVNGQSGEGGKYSFSRYVLGSFFEEILTQANVHLERMTGGKYELLRQQEAGRKNESAGLGIAVMDAYTGERRETASLSGGESFQVSLSLALGLSDVVRQHSGGYTLDAMFIDEGFGSLDEHALEQAMEVLAGLTKDGRQIGIISHVGRLSETITEKLYVKRSPQGSSVMMIKR